MLPVPSLEELLATAREASHGFIDRKSMEILLHQTSPRVRFLKNLPLNSRVLDLGAGEGGIAIFKEWLKPRRADLKIYAVSLTKGEYFHLYEDYALTAFESAGDLFPGVHFDAIYTSNFVEHIEGGIGRLAAWAGEHLSRGALLYIEGPSPNMELLPSTFEVIAGGLAVSTMNFYDDPTHLQTATLEETRKAVEEAGFFVEESGFWRNRYIEDEVLRTGYREQEMVLATLAIWMKALVEQYVVGVKL